jgi:hypothetical protein
MTDSLADYDELILIDTLQGADACVDVPEAIVTDPFEDAVTEEIVMLDEMRLDLVDIELL